MRINLIILVALLSSVTNTAFAAEPGTSKWVFFGPDRRLHYGTDELGNRIMDFSHAGYGGGGVRLPDVPTKKTLNPEPGDNTAHIQAAIDAVSQQELQADGFRGAILLKPGTYEVHGRLTISASGVVLRGSGSEEGGTTIRMRGRPHRLLRIRGSGSRETEGEPVAIADAYIPSGSNSFTVQPADAARFQPGDTVLIRRPVTEAWVRFMGMHENLERNGRPGTWLRPGTSIDADRTIKSVVGYRITLDVPLSDSYDAKYLNPPGATLAKYNFPGRISHVGLESLRVDARPEEGARGHHSVLEISAVTDGWVRDVSIEESLNGISIGSTARRVTLQLVRFHHAESEPHMGGSSPMDMAISGSQVLIDRSSVVGKKIWPIVTQGRVTGPNVVLNFSADEAGVSPHQRWATGLLVDGGEFRNNWEWRPGIALANRENAGSGHGWSAGWSVAWNVKSDFLLVQQPPGAKNWCIGSSGRFTTVLWDGRPLTVPCLPSPQIESIDYPVSPASLYLQQLRERLGDTALENIGYDRSFRSFNDD
jgi:hypothetical protein